MIFIFLCIIAGFKILMCSHLKIEHGNDFGKRVEVDTNKLSAIIRDPKIYCMLPGIVVYGIGYGIYLTIIPTFLIKNGQLSQNSVGWLFIGFYIGISFAQLAGGYIADTKGRFLPMITGLLLFSLGQILFPLCSISMAIGFLTIASFGLGLFFIGSMAALNDYVGNDSKGIISGIFYLFWGSGYFMGPLVLGYAGEQGWYVFGFSSLGIVSFVISILLLIANDNRPLRIKK